MKKSVVLLIVFMMAGLLRAGDITLRPAQVFVGTEVTFEFEPAQPSATYHWDFGDGHQTDTQSADCRHTFAAAGSYRVTCSASLPGIAPDQGQASVTVVDNRRISAQGRNFRQGKKVDFQAENFIGNNVMWDFGDGTVERGPKNHDHVYSEARTFTVKARDQGGDDRAEFTCDVSIEADNRSVEASLRSPRVRDKVVFTAKSFSGNSLRWNFGDGKEAGGGASVTHYFSRPGSFQVRAWESGEAPDTAVGISLTVAPDNRKVQVDPSPPRANAAVRFTAVNFTGPVLKWNFGEGRIESGGLTATHVYASSGRFQVEVREAEDDPESSIKDTITVQPDPRQVLAGATSELFEGSEAEFEARNFASASLRWDFGDGTVEPRGSTRQAHRFLRPGNFLVKVVEADTNNLPIEKRVQVLGDNRSLVLKGSLVFANSEVEIEAQNFRGASVSWDFGDGAPQTGGKLVKHRYARPGQYRVRAVDFAGRDGKTFEKSITVEGDSRSISVPDGIIAGEEVALKVLNAHSGGLTWKFSDGESRSGQESISKAFRSAGPYKVTVVDPSGQYPPLEKAIQVLPDARALKSSAGFTLPKDEVTFTAVQFKGPGVRWDFGDGTVKENGQLTEKHVYESLGRFRVKAVDFSGRSSKVFTSDVVVAEATPGFEVTSLEFVFDNGKYYRVIAKNSPSPGYRLRVKARGRGVLSGQFILDGMSIGLFQMEIQENRIALLPKSQLAGLPTLDLGLHELTLKLNDSPFSKRIPILKYFVSAAGMIRIVAPPIDGKAMAAGPVRLRWEIERQNPLFEIAVSTVPFEFLDDRQIEWRPVGESPEYLLDTKPYKPGAWIYWQVRLLNENKQVQTTSEIASFKLGE